MMKNQYFGDVNDYIKYGLLRVLLNGNECKLLVVWMLTPNDGGRDGEKRAYLKQPHKWKHFDSRLYDGLIEILEPGTRRRVELIEGSKLLPRSSFYSVAVPDNRDERERWRVGLIKSTSGADLVFFDPDNGIEVPSKPIGRKGSSKFVAWGEIKAVWDAGCSVLVYQHFNRKPRKAFTKSLVSKLKRLPHTSFTQAFYTSNVLYLLVIQEKHQPLFRDSISSSLPHWEGQINRVER